MHSLGTFSCCGNAPRDDLPDMMCEFSGMLLRKDEAERQRVADPKAKFKFILRLFLPNQNFIKHVSAFVRDHSSREGVAV